MKKNLYIGDKVLVTPLKNIIGEITSIKAKIAFIKLKKQWSGQPYVSERIFKFHVDTLTKIRKRKIKLEI